MVKISMNFNRGFDEIPGVKPCDSIGTEHSADLSHLVNSFLERETRQERPAGDEFSDDDMESNSPELESLDVLKKLFSHENDPVKRSILKEVQKACAEAGGRFTSSPEFKRRLMTRLRNKGFDAGICRSESEKEGRSSWGSYEYIDVEAAGVRYIVEASFAGEFTIARPSVDYTSLLQIFPQIYVGTEEELKQVVRVICSGIRRSMKAAGIHVPPWRRLSYMQSKWFAPYKRTTNQISGGGERLEGISLRCREDYGGGRRGNLTALLKTTEFIL